MTGWLPVALADGLEPGVSFGTRVDGRELVVWRDTAGTSHVWEDRCPHRGMRLSFGFVRGQHLACLYHGWQFDAGGQCRLIPAHPEITVPKTIRATQYHSVETAGMIWLDVTDADESLVVDDGPTTAVRSLTIDAPPALVATRLPPGPLARFDVDGLPVLAGLQPLSPGETALHLVLAGVFGAAERKRVAAWGMTLRTSVEAELA